MYCGEARLDRIGIVEDVLYGAEHDRPSGIVMRTGLLHQRLEFVPLEDVQAIYPRFQRLLIHSRPADAVS